MPRGVSAGSEPLVAAPDPASGARAAAAAMAPASSAPMLSPSETPCYYDNSLPDLDAEARFAGCEARCRVDVHLPPGDAAAGETRSLLLFVHGGTWRVGDRRSMMFSGRHAALAQHYNVVVLSVGYRRSRMPTWVFFGLYPLVLLLGASFATAPFVMAAVYLLDLPLYAVPVPAVCLFLLYFCFWGIYPFGEGNVGTRGGNFASQCEKGGGVRYETMAGDVARAVRWARDNATRLGADPSKLLLVGHSAGAHLCALVATDSRYLDEVGMLPSEIQGVVGLSGPYSVRKLVTQTSRFVRFATYWMTVRHAFGTEVAQWDASDPGKIVERRCQTLACSNTGGGGGDGPMAVLSVDKSVGVGSRELSRDEDGAIRRLPVFVLLVGDKEVEQAHFEDQMRCLGNNLRAGGHTVHTAVVPGKSHSTTIRHLGAGPVLDTISPHFMERLGVSSLQRP